MNEEFIVAAEPRESRRDPTRSLASAVILLALEDACLVNQDKGIEARRFLFGMGEEQRADREYWLSRAGLPLDCLERFKDFDAQQLKQRLRGGVTERRVRRTA